MRLAFWGREAHLHGGKDTSVKELNYGDKGIAMFHFPKDLFLVDDHLSKFKDGFLHLDNYQISMNIYFQIKERNCKCILIFNSK